MLALAGAACKQTPVRTAQNGVLDLRGQKWTLQGFLLAGEWLFAPQHFSSPERESFSGENIRPMLVPGGWNGRTPGQPGLPADGYGTYFLRVLLEPAARPVSLYLPNVHSAYRLYINGKLVAGVGQPGKNAAESVPQLFPLAIELPDTPAELFVVVQVSNFHHRNGGLWKAPVLMEGRAALTGWRIDLAASWGEFGLYVGMALLFLALYLSMRRQPELIYFSLLCLLTALRAVLTGQRSLVYLFPDLPFHVNYALAVFLVFIGVALGLRVRKIALDKRRIEADYEARNMFFSTISHELRTPLNAIYGTLQLMQDSVNDAGTKKQISAMRHGCDVLLALINDILDLARISAQSFTLRHSPVNLREMLDALLQVFDGAATAGRVKLSLHLEGTIPDFVITDEFRLKQVFINLIGNALKFTEQGEIILGCKVVESGATGADILFSVTDTGIGIPEEEQKIIFDEFFQATSVGHPPGGTGLGLAIARRLVRFMGGDIYLESRQGSGSKFSFQLHFPVTAAPQLQTNPKPVPTPGDLRILAAEDDVVSRMLLSAFLDKAGYRFCVVEDGAQAATELAKNQYDVFLLDIKMPGLSGIEVARLVRQREAEQNAPRRLIVAITANVMPADIAQIRAAGFDAILAKPLNFNELITTLNQVAVAAT
ncbi:MAG: response regulator [Turneriella sp.]|nr:response regulator [Turneriella sp.]